MHTNLYTQTDSLDFLFSTKVIYLKFYLFCFCFTPSFILFHKLFPFLFVYFIHFFGYPLYLFLCFLYLFSSSFLYLFPIFCYNLFFFIHFFCFLSRCSLFIVFFLSLYPLLFHSCNLSFLFFNLSTVIFKSLKPCFPFFFTISCCPTFSSFLCFFFIFIYLSFFIFLFFSILFSPFFVFLTILLFNL